MTDDPTADRRDSSALLTALESLRGEIAGLRDDVREDIAEIRAEVRSAVTDYAVSHGREHQAEREERVDAHRRFDAFIRAAELEQARKDGLLGAFRFGVELFARYAKPISYVLLGLAALIGAASGTITVGVGS